jgi:RNA polymerase sigma-70 factor (ECF subfamily)
MELAIKHKLKLLDPVTSIHTTSEQKLIKELLDGKRTAQKELYQKYFGRMSAVTLRYTRTKEESYEVLNDAFMKVFQNIGQFKGDGNLGAWIYKIVLNTTYSHARKHYKIKERNQELRPDHVITENTALSNLGLELIYDRIQQLPDSHRIVFSMYVLDGLKHKEIAEKLDISEGTSKWYLSTARTQLQELLKQS